MSKRREARSDRSKPESYKNSSAKRPFRVCIEHLRHLSQIKQPTAVNSLPH